MNPLGPSTVLVAVIASFSGGATAVAQRVRQPDVVLIMADDMGYSDIGCYGSEILTPTLGRLARHGVRSTQFFNTWRCCPTRAALLTGLYSHQTGIELMTGDRGYPAYRGDLNRRCVTIAEALRPAGHRPYMFTQDLVGAALALARDVLPSMRRRNPLVLPGDQFDGGASFSIRCQKSPAESSCRTRFLGHAPIHLYRPLGRIPTRSTCRPRAGLGHGDARAV